MSRLNKLRKRIFDFAARGVVDTPPVACDPHSPMIVLSQSYHADLTMYLLAAKSFGQHVRPQRFVVVDDGLTEQDRSVLQHHLGTVQFIPTPTVNTGACPRRGCWERLASIAHLSSDHYVVQLDSDTLTLGSPEAVLECVQRNRSFTLGTRDGGRNIFGVAEAAAQVAGAPGNHVQTLAEQALPRLESADRLSYVRGCAGFAGFARGSLSMEQLEGFSAQMEGLIGRDAWHRWGSEQVASNFVVANTPGACVLPLEQYMNWVPGRDVSTARLLHFIGDYRFRGTSYARMARRAIASMA